MYSISIFLHFSVHTQRTPSPAHGLDLQLGTVTYLPYRVSGLTLTAVGRSQLLA